MDISDGYQKVALAAAKPRSVRLCTCVDQPQVEVLDGSVIRDATMSMGEW